MPGIKVGYARVSTSGQDLTAQREAHAEARRPSGRVYVDHGLTGTSRARPGLREAMAACHAGDELAVTKLDRLARSLPDRGTSSLINPATPACGACSRTTLGLRS